jgi:hypothetical protein
MSAADICALMVTVIAWLKPHDKYRAADVEEAQRGPAEGKRDGLARRDSNLLVELIERSVAHGPPGARTRCPARRAPRPVAQPDRRLDFSKQFRREKSSVRPRWYVEG